MCNCANCKKAFRCSEGVVFMCREKKSEFFNKRVLYTNTCSVGKQG
jgi:hypothetical protein